ncbi:hypothetical protein SLA2020_150010 [Shorea laevis]
MSRVWKDIVSLGSGSERPVEMLVNGFKWEVGDGSFVDFWSSKWVGNEPLKNLFPRLFTLATNREGLVKDMGVWRDESWVWECKWRCGYVGRATGEVEQLREMLNGIQVRVNGVDSWRWVHSTNGFYSVKGAYEFLTPKSCCFDEKWVKVIWNKYVPSKLSVFGWRLFLNRLATKENLCKRGIVLSGGDTGCPLCHEGEE